jgi:hypothetical protein
VPPPKRYNALFQWGIEAVMKVPERMVKNLAGHTAITFPINIKGNKMDYEQHPYFKSYRDYVALCLEQNVEVPTLTEFSGSEAFKVQEVPEPEQSTEVIQ